MKYNATRHAWLLRRAAAAVDAGDWLNMGRALGLAMAMLPLRIVRIVMAVAEVRRREPEVAWR